MLQAALLAYCDAPDMVQFAFRDYDLTFHLPVSRHRISIDNSTVLLNWADFDADCCAICWLAQVSHLPAALGFSLDDQKRYQKGACKRRVGNDWLLILAIRAAMCSVHCVPRVPRPAETGRHAAHPAAARIRETTQ